ncbi:MAG: hypothetical protein CL424_06770 [Acidimicrobiaceae bacterium]|nr:hypothetical protein [Acidimicrobiaceae bacterium]
MLGGEPPLAALYVVAFLVGAGEVLVDNAAQASVPHLAPVGPGGLDAANGRLLAAQTVTNNVIGAPLGAAAFAISMMLPFVFGALSLALCAVLLASLRTPLQTARTTSTTTGIWADVQDGMKALWTTPVLRRLALAGAGFNLCISGAYAVFVLLVVDVHGATPLVYGLMLGVGAVGGLFGSLLAGRVTRAIGRRRTLILATFAAAAGLLGMGLAPVLPLLALMHLVTTTCLVVWSVISQSIRQAVTPDHLLGRVVASFRMIAFAGIPIGAGLVGAVATATSVRSAFCSLASR